ncbi:DUF5627 domain-containing protein [Zobellia uliginosa]|uniref:DUF5627 domain-containing protein n=1 Tax=Zobellia uliginosa TaxID=143224 RepID=UPI0026E234E6|nr:DUF5627 domain-containing protein [Zobellia uliginosa]MDO6517266.1 DUF5627 domain-containing protein [Zobellia uliginosa]
MNTRYFIGILSVLFLASCSNTEPEFDDFDTQTVYFPYQTPARTLVLGNYDQGINEEDNAHRFEITALMTGVYSNDEERKIHFEVDNGLLANVANVKPLPADYYTFESISPVTIASGDTKARIQVQLYDNFFNDTLSFGKVNTTNYVIPLRITQADNIDSVLSGRSFDNVTNPDRANAAHWDILPKDYTLFGIKYMNRFHGNYLRRGRDMITTGTPILGREYNAEFTVDDEIVFVETSGFNKVHLENIIGRGENSSPGNVALELSFDDDTCSISSYKDDPYNVSGTGKFVEGGDTWGGKPRDVIYLDYTYTDVDNSETHAVKDTLVIRDRTAVFEEFEIELK